MNLRGVRRVSVQNFWKIIYELHTSSVVRIIEARRLLSRTNIDPRGMGWRRGGRERLMEKTLKHVAHLTKRILFYWNVWKEENLRNESLRGIKDAHTFLGEHFSGTGDPTILPMNWRKITFIRSRRYGFSIQIDRLRLGVWQRSFPRWTIIDFEGIFIRKRWRNTIVSITYQMDACSI